MATVSASFTATGNGTAFSVRVGDKFTYSVSGTFVATVVLEKSETAGSSWATVINTATAADSGTLVAEGKTVGAHVQYRYRCSAFTSGTAVCALADATQTIQEFKDQNGTVIFRLTEAGVEVPGTLAVTGAATVGGTLGVTGATTLGAGVLGALATDVASATTTDLSDAAGSIVDVTGTTTITAVTLGEGDWTIVRFAGALTFTHGASLVLPGAANITTVAGDYALLVGYASDVVKCAFYQRSADVMATVSGTETLTNKTLTSPVLNAAVTTSGVGAKNDATVTAVEYGCADTVHKTVLTLTASVIAVTSVGAANGYAGLKIYDFPEGYVRILGCVADFTDISIDAAKQADFTDATPEGDIGVGSVIMANADAMGTDATDDDYATASAFTMSAYAATATCAPEAAQNMDGTGTAKDLNVNVLIDAADIDDDVASEVLVTGTVTVLWSNLGDY